MIASGVRNPQGLSQSKSDSNIIIESEHGPLGGDEINVINQVIKTILAGLLFIWKSLRWHIQEEAPLTKVMKSLILKTINLVAPETVGSHGISDISINYFNQIKLFYIYFKWQGSL